MDKKKELLKQIPKVDEVLKDQRLFVFFESTARPVVVEAVREVIDELREKIIRTSDNNPLDMDSDKLMSRISDRICVKKQRSLRRLINGTGTILHTNLGRAGLSEETCRNVAETAANYSTLEYDLNLGVRGSRHEHIEKLITKITGTEAAMAVNNNAAAVFLCLSALASGKDVIVSRGELVEIGGSFRIPEIMKQSGANLVEVGTTNKTRIADYRNAVLVGQTGALLKVHTSNYKIMGFTAEASLAELTELGREKGIPVIYDIGSGLMIDLKQFGIDEPTVTDSVKTGIDVILFSGDKLLGGPQAGIIAGRREYIEKMKRHPLARVLRLDKMTLSALESTFREYLDFDSAKDKIPVLSMITVTVDELRNKAERLAQMVKQSTDNFDVEVLKTEDQIGGGTTPNLFLPGYAVAIRGKDMTLDKIERELRSCRTPLIVRINNEQVLVSMRTVREDEIPEAADALIYVAEKHGKADAQDGGNRDA